jgi:hypothetical protein
MQLFSPMWIVICAVSQHRFINTAMILKIGLPIADQIRRADEYRTFDSSLEKAGRPWFVVGIDSTLETVASRPSNLNGLENRRRRLRTEH